MKNEEFKEVYDIKTPSKFIIGDPYYFEEIEDTEDEKERKELLKLIFTSGKIPKLRKSKLIFQKIKIENFNGYIYEGVFICSNEKYIETYANNQYYISQLKERRELGCDTACYDIEVTNSNEETKYETVNTGADGYYGEVLINKGSYGFVVSFSFPEDLMDEKEMRQILKYLFDCEEILK